MWLFMVALLVTTFIGWLVIWAYADSVYQGLISDLKRLGRIAYLANLEIRKKNDELKLSIKLRDSEITELRSKYGE